MAVVGDYGNLSYVLYTQCPNIVQNKNDWFWSKHIDYTRIVTNMFI